MVGSLCSKDSVTEQPYVLVTQNLYDRTGAAESSLAAGSHFRQLMLIAHALGIRSAVVAATQLDTSPDCDMQARADAVQELVARCLKRVGFARENITFVPVSGLRADNIVAQSSSMGWCAMHSHA
jgi:translation elongation factor EF-1alpha